MGVHSLVMYIYWKKFVKLLNYSSSATQTASIMSEHDYDKVKPLSP